MTQLSYNGFFYNYLVVAKKGAEHLFVYSKNALRLGDVYYGIVRSFNAPQKTYFVSIGRENDIYVKAKYMPKNIKPGDGVFIQITCEAIKTKPAAGRFYTDDALKLTHYKAPCLLSRASDSVSDAEGLSAIDKFKAKKFDGKLYHKFDVLAVLTQQLDSDYITKRGVQLIVDELEALTAIDINAHNYKSNVKTDDFALNLNKSCISDIFDVLNTRRISGTVVIDFLNMQKRQHASFLDSLTSHLTNNSYPYLGLISIKGFTQTGLLELSVQKKYKSLWSSAVVKDDLGYRIKEEIYIDLLIDKFRTQDLKEGARKHLLEVSPRIYKIIGDKRQAFDALVDGIEIELKC